MIRAPGFVWNTGVSLAFQLTVRSAGALAFIAIGRLSGARDAGTFSLALGYLAILTTLFLGLDDLLVRESAMMPERTKPLLATYGVIRFGLSLGAWLLLLQVLALISVYSPSDLAVLAVVTGCVLIDSFTGLSQSILNAHGHFGWPLVAAGSVARLVGVILSLLAHLSLFRLTLVWPVGSAFTAAILAGALFRHIGRVEQHTELRFERGLARHLVRLMPAFAASRT